MNKVVLIDGNNLLFRSYYATAYSGSILKNSKGLPTNALYGFVGMINKIISEENPEYIVVAFDIGKNFRKEKYDFYKEGRHDTPEELKMQFPIARKILEYYMMRSDIYENSCLNNYDFDTISFDILYCDGEKTHQINKEYRNKDYTADIITFAIFADTEEEDRIIFDGEINLGEIVLGLDKIMKSAREKGVSREEELCFLIAHGILHLLGFDHQTDEDYNFIIEAQKTVLNKIKDKDV